MHNLSSFMAESRCFRNDLKLVPADAESLNAALNVLKEAIAVSVEILMQSIKAKRSSRDSLYTGDAGESLL